MSSGVHFTKRAADAFVAAVNFASWPITASDPIVTSNARGSIGVAIYDANNVDVSASMSPYTPQISGTKVEFWLLGGTPMTKYRLVATAPTQSGELLTAEFPLLVTG